MGQWSKKKSNLWLLVMMITVIIGSIIGNAIGNKNIIGGVLSVLILTFIPLGIELIRKKDPIVYYGLDFVTLKRIPLKSVFTTAVIIFLSVAFTDFFLFDILTKISSAASGISVGSTSIALAKSKYFYLSVFVVFAATLMEELWFRGLIQYKLNSIPFLKIINPHFAILTQAVLFRLIHFLPIYYGSNFDIDFKLWFFVYPTIIGIILGYINEKYHSLWPSWIIHYTNNLTTIALFTVIFKFGL